MAVIPVAFFFSPFLATCTCEIVCIWSLPLSEFGTRVPIHHYVSTCRNEKLVNSKLENRIYSMRTDIQWIQTLPRARKYVSAMSASVERKHKTWYVLTGYNFNLIIRAKWRKNRVFWVFCLAFSSLSTPSLLYALKRNGRKRGGSLMLKISYGTVNWKHLWLNLILEETRVSFNLSQRIFILFRVFISL